MDEKIKEAQQEVWEMARFITKMNYEQAYKVFGFGEDLSLEYSSKLLVKDHIKGIFNDFSFDELLEKYRAYKKNMELHRGDVVDTNYGYKGVVFYEEPGDFGTLYTIVYDDGTSETFRIDELTKTGKTIDLSAFDELEEENE